MAAKRKEDRFSEIRNAKASHQYIIHERYEAGIVLTGTEVKSVRMGKAQINEAFARVEKGEVVLYHAHISEYAFGTWANHNPVRPRKLLLNKAEIRRILGAVEAGGRTIIPTRMYLKHGLVKVEIGVCTGKKLHDKRETLKERTEMREADIAMRAKR
ncbi:MAG: SsrA-binding protein SmpB [Opitutales bacterium]|nr:SsrA-binding protein SmpB [Opitutales bacterium]